MKINKFEFENDWINWIGKEICKHSNKPFKSTLLKGMPISLTINPKSGKQAFLMDDSSIVDCYQCKLV